MKTNTLKPSTPSRKKPGPTTGAADAVKAERPTLLVTTGTFLRQNASQIFHVLLAGTIINLFITSMPIFSMVIYDKVIGNHVHETLWALTAGMALIIVLDQLLRAGRVYFVEHAGALWDKRLDERLFHAVLAAPSHRHVAPGVLLAKYKELSSSREFLSSSSLLTLADIPFLALFIVICGLIGGWTVLAPIIIGCILLAATAGIQSLAAIHQRDQARLQADKLDLLYQALMNRSAISAAASSVRAFHRRFEAASHSHGAAAARARYWTGLAQQIPTAMLTACTVAILVVGTFMVEAQQLTVGNLIAVSTLGSRILMYFSSISSVAFRFREFRRALADMRDLVDLDAPRAEEAADMTVSMPPAVSMHELQHRHSAASPFELRGVDAHIAPGSLCVLVGRPGSGKTTLLRMLVGDLAPTGGRIAFAGRVIETAADRRHLARNTAYKPQDPAFISGTVGDIVAEWSENLSDEAAERLLRMSGLSPTLDAGEIGLNTPVDAGGSTLSGGQRQMLAVARALASGRSCLVFDEPTSGFDAFAQGQFLSTLKQLKGNKTIIVSTHLSDLVALADQILVLDGGRIVAAGPPGKLLHKNNSAFSAIGSP